MSVYPSLVIYRVVHLFLSRTQDFLRKGTVKRMIEGTPTTELLSYGQWDETRGPPTGVTWQYRRDKTGSWGPTQVTRPFNNSIIIQPSSTVVSSLRVSARVYINKKNGSMYFFLFHPLRLSPPGWRMVHLWKRYLQSNKELDGLLKKKKKCLLFRLQVSTILRTGLHVSHNHLGCRFKSA